MRRIRPSYDIIEIQDSEDSPTPTQAKSGLRKDEKKKDDIGGEQDINTKKEQISKLLEGSSIKIEANKIKAKIQQKIRETRNKQGEGQEGRKRIKPNQQEKPIKSQMKPEEQQQSLKQEQIILFSKEEQPSTLIVPSTSTSTPWLSSSTASIHDSLLRFHNQIVEFYHYMAPHPKEILAKLKLLDQLKGVVREVLPLADVKPFGSFATKLSLPDGDIDVAILLDNSSISDRSCYQIFYKHLQQARFRETYTDLHYISKSKVPLIKVTHAPTGTPLDISVNKQDGLSQLQHVQRMIKAYPQYKYLSFVFKTMLKIRDQGQTYTGGIGSFLLFCMLWVYLREVTEAGKYYTLGEHVLQFMDYYSSNTKWERVSLEVATGREWKRQPEPGTLSFISPQGDEHDIGKSAFKIRNVFLVWKNRVRCIMSKNFGRGESILKELVNPQMQVFKYYRGK